MLLTYKNEITILYSGECRNTYFKIKKSGGNEEQNKRKGLSKVTSFAIHHVYSYRKVPMFSLGRTIKGECSLPNNGSRGPTKRI